MSRATPDDQLKFLLSCVRHSNNGKIDFIEVANECGVVSKGAAAKRYERLLKANGIHPNGGPAEKSSTPTLKQRSKAEIAKSAVAKRRKIEGDSFNFKVDDEDDIKPLLKSEPMDAARIKHEPDNILHPLSYQNIATTALPPFFPRTPITQIGMHGGYPPRYVPLHQQPTFRFPPPSPAYSTVPHLTQQSNEDLPAHNHHQPSNDPQSSISVSEEQIQSMFDEFCRQDMFKQPRFDHPSAQHTNTTADSTGAPTNNVSELSSRAKDDSNTSSPNGQGPKKSSPDSSMTDLPPPIIHERTGKGVDDSILIAD